VDEDIGVASSLEDLAGGTRVAGQRDLAPVAWRTENLLRLDGASFRQRDCLAVLQSAEQRPFRDAQRARRIEVEAARTGGLE
jgi:hypothetical protein